MRKSKYTTHSIFSVYGQYMSPCATVHEAPGQLVFGRGCHVTVPCRVSTSIRR